jgi:hypothetical protein
MGACVNVRNARQECATGGTDVAILACMRCMQPICATLCQVGGRSFHSILLLVALISGCEATANDRQPGTGGSGGAPPITDCTVLRTYPDCGSCQMALEEYCTASAPCELDRASICTRIWWGSTWSRGCGHVRVEYWGDVSDRGMNIWDEASGRLVYHWFNGMLSAGCLPDTRVGVEPACEEWVDACESGEDAG